MQIQNPNVDPSSPIAISREDDQFQGFWFHPNFLQGTKQVLEHFKPLPSDVILASSPKTGTTWLKSLLHAIANRYSKNQLITSHPHEFAPTLELQVYTNSTPYFLTATSSSTRILSTHIPYQILGKTMNSSDCQVVYVARKPKDTLISCWHFVNSIDGSKIKPRALEDAIDKFCEGVVIFGPYYKNVLVRSRSIETWKNHEVNKFSDVPSWSMRPSSKKGRLGITQIM